MIPSRSGVDRSVIQSTSASFQGGKKYQRTLLNTLLHGKLCSSSAGNLLGFTNSSKVFVEHALTLEHANERLGVKRPAAHRGHARISEGYGD